MNIKLDFNELSKVLGFVNTIINDKAVDAKTKNVIFLVSKNKVQVVGYNALIFSRTTLENVTISDDVSDEGWNFQIRANDSNKIIASFSSLSKTEVEGMVITDDGVKVKVIVSEKAIKEEDSRLSQKCEFALQKPNIIPKVEKEIQTPFPEESDSVESGDLLLYLDSLFSIMSNDNDNGVASKLNFADDYVFVINTKLSSFLKNKLPEAFRGITLGYSSVNFLLKLCESSELLEVSRSDKNLCVRAGNTEAFMKYQNIKVNYKMYIDRMDKTRGIVVDRMYLKDVLKRMGTLSPEGIGTITGNELQVENDNFQQVIPLDKVKEGTSGISFKFSTPVMEKLILGKDSLFKDDLFCYFVESPRGYYLYVSDKTGVWFSNSHVFRN